ncbi:hypothetical protein KKH43_03560 [Patescibacteria group bacterium]|nr:hypothetical protein [Patescibacteria group bacterium]
MKKLTQINLVVSCIAALIEAVIVIHFATKTGDLIGTSEDVRYYVTLFIISSVYYFVYLVVFWVYGLLSGKLKGEAGINVIINLLASVTLFIGHAFFALVIVGGIAF